MQSYVILSVLVSIATAQSCYDSGDHLIYGRCFKLVGQKLPYHEAQNWCHTRQLYLATVADSKTNSYLASYARTAFNDNSGNFWIGLFRTATNNKWQWDDGTPVGWTNFQNPNQNFASESIKNAIWDTYVPETRLNFVCSYWPGERPTPVASTTPPAMGTTEWEPQPTTSDGECTRRTNSAILFAYSNDIDSQDFSIMVDNLVYLTRYADGYTKFANVRFDVQIEEVIQYHSDVLSFNQSIYDRSPDSSLGYKDNRGSNVLSVLQKFLDNDQAPLCGSLVHVLVGRYPDETDVSYLVNRLRENHVFVYFAAKATPSAGNNPKILCDVASSTNGFCAFADDSDFYRIGWRGNNVLLYPYQFVAQNYVVSGSGRLEVPVFQTPIPYSGSDIVLVVITLQDHPPVQEVSMDFTVAGPNGRCVFNGPRDPGTDRGQYGTECTVLCFLNGTTDYKWTIDYSYPNNEPQIIQARMYSKFYHDFLPLPPI